MSSKPGWNPQWEPARRGGGGRALSFGSDDGPGQLVRLEGGYAPLPIPPDYQAPPTGLPTVQTIEPLTGWWTQAGKFGFKFQGEVPGEGIEIPLTENLTLPGPPAPVWLNWFRYNRNVSGEFTPAGNFELRGRLIYGVGGVQNIVDVDLIQGIQLPIVCNSLAVQLVTYNPYDDATIAAPYVSGLVTAGVVFGKGAAGGSLPATWTSKIVEADGATGFGPNANVTVPDFARSVALHVTTIVPLALATITLSFLDLGGAVIKVLSMDPALSYDVLTQEGGVAIPAGTNSVSIGSAATPIGTRAMVQFFLAL